MCRASRHTRSRLTPAWCFQSSHPALRTAAPRSPQEQQQALEAQHQAAEEDLERTRQQHAALQHQNRVLEGLLAVRDSSLAVLERAKVRGGRGAGFASGRQGGGQHAACSTRNSRQALLPARQQHGITELKGWS